MHKFWLLEATDQTLATDKCLENQGCTFDMAYIRLQNRFQKYFSKLYAANREKPVNTSKTHYVDEIMQCPKSTFLSTHQCIEESMTSLKQYMPLKLVKRVVKKWMQSDAKSSHVYGLNISKERGRLER